MLKVGQKIGKGVLLNWFGHAEHNSGVYYSFKSLIRILTLQQQLTLYITHMPLILQLYSWAKISMT